MADGGGPTFFPRMAKRPEYPGWGLLLRDVVTHYGRAPLMMAALALALEGWWVRTATTAVTEGAWSEVALYTLVTCLVHSGLYVVTNALLLALTRVAGDKYLMAHARAVDAAPELWRRTLAEAALSQLVLTPVATVVVLYPIAVRLGMPSLRSPLLLGADAARPYHERLAIVWTHFALADFFNGFVFYWVHRAFHSKLLYARFHKQHHSWKNTRGIAAEFANPVEQLAANLGPTLGGMVLLGRHPLEMWIWLAYRLYSTYEAHSNLYLGHTWLAKIGLTVSEDAAFHSFHHEQSHRGNFSYPHWDILFGTMDHWLAEGGTEGYVAKRLGKGHLD